MKKAGVFILFAILFCNLIFINNVNADVLDLEPEEVIGFDPDDIPTDEEELKDVSSEYLKQEWEKIINNSAILSKFDSSFKKLNPFFKVILGIDYSLSWRFFFALFIWGVLILFLASILKVIFNDYLLGFFMSFVMVSIAGISGVIRKAVEVLARIVTDEKALWISLILTFLIGVILVKLGGGISKILEREKERLKKEEEELIKEDFKFWMKVLTRVFKNSV